MDRKGNTVIAVDFDGTLCKQAWPEIGEENGILIAHLKKQQAAGARLILWTNREGELLEAAVEWCKARGLTFDTVNENLPELIELYQNDGTRFARNTVECIQTIRKLKEIGVGIYFEKENINTLSEKSELFITILASVAQGESENISSNNRWAIQKRFQDGTYIISTPAYGYGKDEDGNLVIIESEAETVRWIYESYLNGMGVYVIAKALNQKGIPTIRGAEKWQDGVIQDILKNPIYEGDMLQQRTYTETRFPFVRRVNNGQRNQYLIKDSHPPIVTHEEAEAVRNLMAYRVDVL